MKTFGIRGGWVLIVGGGDQQGLGFGARGVGCCGLSRTSNVVPFFGKVLGILTRV